MPSYRSENDSGIDSLRQHISPYNAKNCSTIDRTSYIGATGSGPSQRRFRQVRCSVNQEFFQKAFFLIFSFKESSFRWRRKKGANLSESWIWLLKISIIEILVKYGYVQVLIVHPVVVHWVVCGIEHQLMGYLGNCTFVSDTT